MEKVIVTRPIVGIYAMQVCAKNGVSDEEILEQANVKNPAGSANGWSRICRNDPNHPNSDPVQCKTYSDRMHYILFC